MTQQVWKSDSISPSSNSLCCAESGFPLFSPQRFLNDLLHLSSLICCPDLIWAIILLHICINHFLLQPVACFQSFQPKIYSSLIGIKLCTECNANVRFNLNRRQLKRYLEQRPGMFLKWKIALLTGCAQFCNAIPQQEIFNGFKKGYYPRKNSIQFILANSDNHNASTTSQVKKWSPGWKTTDCVFSKYFSLFEAETRQWFWMQILSPIFPVWG